MLFDFQVRGDDWRRAFSAVVPHAGVDPENDLLRRLRVYVGLEFLVVVATTGFSAAMARIGVRSRETADLGCFDLSPFDAKRALAFFPRSSELMLRIRWAEKALAMTDVSGLFPGESITIHPHPTDLKYPSVALALELALAQTAGRGEGDRVLVPASRLALFAAAGKAYGELLSLEPVAPSAAQVITCGPDFIGLAVTDKASAATHASRDDQRSDWAEIFHDVGLSHPRAPMGHDEPAPGPVADPAALLQGVTVKRVDRTISEYDHDEAAKDEPAQADSDDPQPIESIPLFAGDPIPVVMLDLLQSAAQALATEETTSMRQLKVLLGVGQDKAQRVMALLRDFNVIGPDHGLLRPAEVLISRRDLPEIMGAIDAERRRGGFNV